MGCAGSKSEKQAGQVAAPTSNTLGRSSPTCEASPRPQPASGGAMAASTVLEGGPVLPEVRGEASPATASGKTEPSPATASRNSPGGMLRKARTAIIDKAEVDIMVTQFVCHDSNVLSHIGKGSKESTWRVQAGRDVAPIDIKLHVDRNIVAYPEVGVECDGKRVFPASGRGKGKLKEDFIQQWPFRGNARGIGEERRFEIRFATGGADTWFPATLTKQRADGLFEALALIPNGSGAMKEVSHPAVAVVDIRDAVTGGEFQVPQRTLTLEVPAHDPTHAVLSVDGHDLITHHFARTTPPPALEPKVVSMQVSKDRDVVMADVGHSVLTHYLSNEVRIVTQNAEKLKRSWTIQIGPYAEHTIEIEKKWSSRIITLTVDGEKFVEASAEDIDCVRDRWECSFRFVGESCINFDVYETNVDGFNLDTRAVVGKRSAYTRECHITLIDEADFTSAEFTVDGVDFRSLPAKCVGHEEERVQVSAQVLGMNYGVFAPYKVNEQAPTSLATFWDDSSGLKVRAGFPGVVGPCGGGFFGFCSQVPVAIDDS